MFCNRENENEGASDQLKLGEMILIFLLAAKEKKKEEEQLSNGIKVYLCKWANIEIEILWEKIIRRVCFFTFS